MSIPDVVRDVLNRRGSTQVWVIGRMNAIDPTLNMNRTKFSAIVRGTRKMTGDELLVFCKATETNPDDLFAAAEKVG